MKKHLLVALPVFALTLTFAGCGKATETPVNDAPAQDPAPVVEETTEEVAMTAGTYAINTEDSRLSWTGQKVIGDAHTGIVMLKSGELMMDEEGKLAGGMFTIDMTTISSTDLSGGPKASLDGHLKGQDFFDTETYPEAMLKITSAEMVDDPTATHQITADLTIKGVTEAIVFPATIAETDAAITGQALMTLDRTKWNITYGSGNFFKELGDKAIEDDMTFEVSIVANK